jgi:hypothetical protein
MTDEIDRILATDPPPPPSPGFAASVLAAVRTAAATPPPLPFPWRRYLAGLALLSGLSGLAEWIAATQPALAGLGGAFASALVGLADPHLALALAEAAGGLAGAYAVVWLTARLTGARR